MLRKPPTGEYLYYQGKKRFDRCVLGEKLYSVEDLEGVHRFNWMFTERFEEKTRGEYKEFLSCNEGEEVWWYDNIGVPSGSAGLLKIKEDQIIGIKILIRR